MDSVYLEYIFRVVPLQPGTEILIAELGYAGFESFVEDKDGVKAYIQKAEWRENILADINIFNSEEFKIDFSFSEIAQVNWNAEWEKNFDPIEVDRICTVRAPFHPRKEFKYDIVIEPKMSFGTGHHETTFMMLQYILEHDFKGKSVLDMGCGTAVLAILAEMRGAISIEAIDIDSWCFENSKENIVRNQCENITAFLGSANLLAGKTYDIIIANINRNILLQDMKIYADCLSNGGNLFLSGFYSEDLNMIQEACNNLGLNFVDSMERNNWIAAKFVN